MIEKILERLEVVTHDNPMVTDKYILREDAIKIVQEVAKDDGWIPCNERLPEYDWYSTVCWVTLKNKFGLVCTRKMRWCGNGRWIWVNGHDLGSDWEAIAWKPYEAPAPYQKGE